jgi:P4 family phage/plasmid primase-like protien
VRDQDYQVSIDFLKGLFGETPHKVELRACGNTRDRGAVSSFDGDTQRFCERHDELGMGVYFGVATRGDWKKANGDLSGAKDNVAECPALWVDIDCVKAGIPGDAALHALAFLPFPPSIVVNSGGGLHAYWVLEEALDVSDGHYVNVEIALRQLAHILAGDMACAEIARIMRLPGSHNSKDATLALNDGQPVEVTVIEQTGRVYDFEALREWLGEQRAVLHAVTAPTTRAVIETDPFVAYARAAGYEPAIDIDAELAAMAYGASGLNSVHPTQLRVSASMIGRGYDDDEIVARILAATEAAAPCDKQWNWAREEREIAKMVATGRAKGYGEKVREKPTPPRLMAVGNTAVSVVADLQEERAKREPKAKKETGDRPDEIIILGGATLAVWEDRYGPIQHSNGRSYCYRDGIWHEWTDVHDQVLRIMLQEGCERLKLSPKPGLLNAAQTYFLNRPEMFVDGVQFDQGNIIVAGDGVLELDTMQILPHSPAFQASYKIAGDLHGARGCPAFLGFLRDAFADQPVEQIDDIIRSIQEWFGACLVRQKPRSLMKGMLVWGASRTGKTQLSEILRGLLGADTTVATSVADIGTDFGLQSLLHARGWIADDAVGQGETLDAERYKKLVTGEQIGVRVKGLSDRQMRFGRPVMLTMNNLPRIKDGSLAVYNRSIMVKMTVVRDEAAPEPVGYNSIAAKVIAEELSGVLWWAIEGWRVASARGRFDEPACMLDAIKSLQRSNDAVRAWVEDGAVEDNSHKVAKSDLFAAFCGWYFLENGGGKNPWSQNGFMKALKNVLPSIGEQAAAVRYVTGVKLTDEGVQHWSTDQERDLQRVTTKTMDTVFINQSFSASHSQRVRPIDLDNRSPRF